MMMKNEATANVVPTVNDMFATNMMSTSRSSVGGIFQQSSITQFYRKTAPFLIDLNGLSFFQFQRLMNFQNKLELSQTPARTKVDSADVVNEFEKMLTVNDTLVEKLVANYWTQPSPLQPSDRYIYSFESDSTIYPDTNDGFESLAVCKPLGIELLNNWNSSKDWGILEWFQKEQMDVLYPLCLSTCHEFKVMIFNRVSTYCKGFLLSNLYAIYRSWSVFIFQRHEIRSFR